MNHGARRTSQGRSILLGSAALVLAIGLGSGTSAVAASSDSSGALPGTEPGADSVKPAGVTQTDALAARDAALMAAAGFVDTPTAVDVVVETAPLAAYEAMVARDGATVAHGTELAGDIYVVTLTVADDASTLVAPRGRPGKDRTLTGSTIVVTIDPVFGLLARGVPSEAAIGELESHVVVQLPVERFVLGG